MQEELRSKARNFLAVKASEAKYRGLMESAQVDVGTVVKASQAVSSEIELGKLIETLLRIAVEHAGAYSSFSAVTSRGSKRRRRLAAAGLRSRCDKRR